MGLQLLLPQSSGPRIHPGSLLCSRPPGTSLALWGSWRWSRASILGLSKLRQVGLPASDDQGQVSDQQLSPLEYYTPVVVCRVKCFSRNFCHFFPLQFSIVIPRQETAASPLPDQVRGGAGGGDHAGVAGGSRHGVRPGGGAADHSEAATDGGSDDRGVAQLLQEDCPVKHRTRWVFPDG